MANELSISTILQIAKICEYSQSINAAKNIAFKGVDIDQRIGRLIYMERKSVQNRYDLNPSDTTLPGTANYLFSILKGTSQAQRIINNLAQSPPIITGPANQSGNVGFTAVFSVSVVSALPVTYQWFDYLGNPIIGATSSSYSFVNAQLTDTGKTFFVKAINAAGTTVSNTATLTVSAALVALTWYGDTDPATDLQANIDNFSYQITTSITHNAAISIAIPQIATPNKFFVTKVPIGENVKTTWFNTPTNQGTFSSDFNYQNPIQFGGFTYYYSRQALSLDYTQPLILS